jgi:poly-gamma-glutamate synthase PgsB/CapB
VMISSFKPLLALSVCLAILLLYLLAEKLLLERRLGRIRLRICVAGTRGKSSVTRLIASVLREAGYKTLAKTTGSKPMLILPDGIEKEIGRAGPPSILEQKKVLRTAAESKSEAAVIEMMSIKAECLRAESEKLLKPHVLIITNVRLDHLEDMGGTKSEIAKSLAAAITGGSTVLVLDDEMLPVFEEAAERSGSKILRIPKTLRRQESVQAPGGTGHEFEENQTIALAVADYLKIDRETARRGIEKAQPDFGSLKVFKVRLDDSARTYYLASLFAANDPESTDKALFHLRRQWNALPEKTIGLLNLRYDRGDRSLQWIRALENGFFKSFERLIFIGDHAHALGRKRKWFERTGPNISALPEKGPRKIMDTLFACESGDAVVIGLGNMGGLGEKLVDYWARIGTRLI